MTLPAASKQVTTGTDGPLVRLQLLDERGVERLAKLRTGPAGELGSYDTCSLMAGTVWVWHQSLRRGTAGAVFGAFTQFGGGAHRSYIGVYDWDRCPDRKAAAAAWAQVSELETCDRIPVAEVGADASELPHWGYEQFVDDTVDGALAVAAGGRLVWMPAPQAGVGLNDHVEQVLGGPNPLGGPAAGQLLNLVAESRRSGQRIQAVVVSTTLARRLLVEWDPPQAPERLAQLRQLAAARGSDPMRGRTSTPAAIMQVGPLSVMVYGADAEDPAIDLVDVIAASGPRGDATSHHASDYLLAANPFWTGPQDREHAHTYARLRQAGLSPEQAAVTLPVALAPAR